MLTWYGNTYQRRGRSVASGMVGLLMAWLVFRQQAVIFSLKCSVLAKNHTSYSTYP